MVGPNRFLRHFTGDVHTAGRTAAVQASYYQGDFGHRPMPKLTLELTNSGAQAVTFIIVSNNYSADRVRTYHVPAHGRATHRVDPLESANGWYDLSVTLSCCQAWSRRYTGHLENGKNGITG